MKWSGGCLCGAVKYVAKGEPIIVGSCHCINCRKMSGAAFVTYVFFKPEQFEWVQGELGTHASTPDLVRAFCRDCGSPISAWRQSERDKWINVWAGSLDQAEKLTPQHHIYAKDELPWLHLEDGLERFETFSKKVLADLGVDSPARDEQMKSNFE